MCSFLLRPQKDVWELTKTGLSPTIPCLSLSPFPQDGLLLLAEKLQGPFSFELAAESIGVKISEGLMHLQENSVKVSAKVRGGKGGDGVWAAETMGL